MANPLHLLTSALDWFRAQPLQPGPTYGAPREGYAALSVPSYQIGRPTWPERDPATYDSAGYRKLALIYRCVNLIAHAAGTAPVRVYDEARDNETLPDHPMRRLMRQPNPQHGEALFWANVALRAAIAGFCVVEKERNGFNEVIALNPLRSPWLKAIPQSGNQPPNWDYQIPGIREPYHLAAADVIAFRWADTPDGSPYGLPPLAVAFRDVGLLDKMIAFLAVLFERGGVPMWGLLLDRQPGDPQPTQGEIDTLTERFLRRHGGIEQAAIPTILAGIKDVKRLGFDLDELAYTDLRDVSELALVQAFGVPPTKAMIRVGLEHSDSRANAEVDDATFYRDTMVPLWTRFDDALTSGLLPDFEPPGSSISLEFDTSDIPALQPHRDDRATWVIAGFQAGGFSQHTLHRELGLPLPPTDDFYLRGLGVEAIPVTNPLAGGSLAALPPGQRLAATGPAERLAAIGATNKRHIAVIAKAHQATIRRFFRAQGQRVVAALKAPVGIAALAGHNGHALTTYALHDLDWDAENRRLAEALRPLHMLAGDTAFSAAADALSVDISWDLANPRVLSLVNQLADAVVGINATTRADIDRIVTQGLDAGTTLDAIADDLTGLFEETYKGRALTIARTESQTAFNLASGLAYQESGVVERAQLFDNPDHDSDPLPPTNTTCAQRDGLVIDLDEIGDYVASAHPSCQLAFAPIVSEGAE